MIWRHFSISAGRYVWMSVSDCPFSHRLELASYKDVIIDIDESPRYYGRPPDRMKAESIHGAEVLGAEVLRPDWLWHGLLLGSDDRRQVV